MTFIFLKGGKLEDTYKALKTIRNRSSALKQPIIMQSAIQSDYGNEIQSVPIEHRFNPYDDNGGTILGIASEDFAIIAGDTRHTTGYSINSREEPKVFDCGDDIIISANGFAADSDALIKRFQNSVKWYHFDHNKKLKLQSAARNIQHILYAKRMFPYYVHTIVAGLDDEGKGALYSFDPVGSYERNQCIAGGAAAALIMPFLDNQISFKNQYVAESNGTERKPLKDLSLEDVIRLVRDAFNSATERHIHVGDNLQIMIVTKDGVKEEYYELKKD
ncbi:HDL317Wp [Eremothecium sinecaudum]|uniref:HDL317Wp n=1 Tax=Eremothecium sinecaudum TaxID=45286 RepID=A0A0X8HS26_9SACH|nr:HDL317Wp [Eremothecium sinecaudum]AMD20427.1 HDL317Wp [Eremothecium sinecaudum]